MGVNKTDEDNKDFAAGFDAAREENFSYLDPTSNASGNTTNVTEAGERNNGFPAVTEEDLGHLAPGCFVQVGLGETSYWVEIGLIEGAAISGMMHP